MKLFLAFFIVLSTAPSSKESAVLSFYSNTFSFPDTKEGVLLKCDFKFINSGNTPLLITDYKVACSCTKLIYPKVPILPGKEGLVTLHFDTNQKYGYQNRVVEVYSNASKKPEKIRIKVNVIPKGYE